jgi:hypothetical protein
VPFTGTLTALTTKGQRLDVDLSKGVVTRTFLNSSEEILADSYDLRATDGGLVAQLAGGVMVLPVAPSADVEIQVGEYLLRAPANLAPLTRAGPRQSTVRSSPADRTAGVVIDAPWVPVGSTGSELVLEQYSEEAVTAVALQAGDASSRQTIANAGAVLAVGRDLVVLWRWPDGIRLWTSTSQRSVDVPDGWTVGEAIDVGEDGVVAMSLGRGGASPTGRATVGILHRQDGELEVVGEDVAGFVTAITRCGDWVLWLAGPFGGQRGLFAYNLSTGDVQSIRLQDRLAGIAAHDCG